MTETQWNDSLTHFESSMAGLTQTIDNLNRAEANKWAATEQMRWTEEMMNKQNAFSLDMWNKTNEYNAPEAQVQRLINAGLNPLYYGLDGSSAKSFESAQPLAYERANIDNRPNPIAVQASTYAQLKTLENQTKIANAQVDKMKEETGGLKLDNQWKEETMQARTEAESLKNDVLRSDIRLKEQDLKNKEQELSKLIAETDNEIAKNGYILAQTALQNAMKMKTDEETATIIALRPLEIQLKKAQTQAQKAAAAAQFANALYTNGLVEAGYIDKQVELIAAQTENYEQLAKTQEVQRYLTEFKNSIKSGNLFDFLNGYQPRGKVGQFISDFGSSFFQFMSIAGEAISSVPGFNSAFGAALGASIGTSPSGATSDVVGKQIASMPY